MNRKRRLPLLQLAVTGTLLWWVFRDAALRAQLAVVWVRADWRWILLGLAFAGLDQIANVVRWWIFLRVQKIDAPFRRVVEVFMAGVFFSSFLPGTVSGDVLKTVWLTREHRGKGTAVVLSIVADRIIGLVGLIAVTAWIVFKRYAWLSQTPVATVLTQVLIGFTVFSTLGLAMSFLFTRKSHLDWMPAWVPGRSWLVKTGTAWHLFVHEWRGTLAATALSFPVMVTYFATFWCAARAFGAGVSMMDIFSVMPVITLITALPVFIGGLGAREQLFKQLLGDLAGTPADIAVAISITGFAIYLVWSLVGAVLFVTMRPSGLKLDGEEE
jgi:glycosyltransferase 2 family protein